MMDHTRDWSLLAAELARFRELPDDWDGEGSPAVDPAIIQRALTELTRMQEAQFLPPQRVVAGVNGTLYFEWFESDGYRELEVLNPMHVAARWLASGASLAVPIELEASILSRCWQLTPAQSA